MTFRDAAAGQLRKMVLTKRQAQHWALDQQNNIRLSIGHLTSVGQLQIVETMNIYTAKEGGPTVFENFFDRGPVCSAF